MPLELDWGWGQGARAAQESLPGSLLSPSSAPELMVISLICCLAVTSPQLLSLGSAAGASGGAEETRSYPRKGEGHINLAFLKCVFC